MNIGDSIEFTETKQRGKTVTLSMRKGTIIDFRKVKQAKVKQDGSRFCKWVDVKELNRS